MTQRQMMKKVAERLIDANYWMVISVDDKGTYLDCGEPSHISLIAHLFHKEPEIMEKTMVILDKLKEFKDDNGNSI